MRISDWSSDVCSSDLGGAGLEHADALDDAAVLGDVVVDHHGGGHPLQELHLVGAEVLDEAEVEERHLPARSEQVVAGVGIAVEGAQAVEAAEQEAERSEGRREGKECVSTCRSRWSAYD